MGIEYWDLVDKTGRPTGERVRRSPYNKFGPGKYHMVVHVWIKNSAGEYLIQRRSLNKEPMAGKWAATGGAVISGESSVDAASRELYEELGIRVRPEELRHVARFERQVSITDVWYVGIDASIDGLELQKEEVMCAKWVTKDRLCKMIESGEFHNYGKDYFDAIFEI